MPLRVTLCGLSAALSLIASVPIHAPPIVGVKLTEIEQLFPAARLAPQLVADTAKSLVAVILVITEALALPLLLSLTDLGVLVVPTA